MGGLSKKIHLIKQYEQKQTACLIVDAGNLLFTRNNFPAGKLKKVKKSASAIQQAFIAQSNAIAGVGPYDLAAGIPFLQKATADAKLKDNYVCANLFDAETKHPLFSPFALRKVGDLQVAVIGLAHLANTDKGMVTEEIWQLVLPELLANLAKSDLIILLSSYPDQVNREIAKLFDQIHILIESGTPSNSTPQLINNTLLCKSTARGKFQPVLTVHWDTSKKWKIASSQGEGEEITGGTASYEQKFIPLNAAVAEDRQTRKILNR